MQKALSYSLKITSQKPFEVGGILVEAEPRMSIPMPAPL